MVEIQETCTQWNRPNLLRFGRGLLGFVLMIVSTALFGAGLGGSDTFALGFLLYSLGFLVLYPLIFQ